MKNFLDKQFIYILIISIAVSFVLFGNTIKGDWTLDDFPVVKNQPELRSFKNIPKLFVSPWHPQGEFAGNYRPLTLVSFALNFIFSESTVSFHLTNIFLYALNAALIFLLVRKLSSLKTAYLTFALFMFLPIHSEPVSSIVGRVYLLGTFFSLFSLIYFFKKKFFLSSLFFISAVLAGDLFFSVLGILFLLVLFNWPGFSRAVKIISYFIIPIPFYFFLRYLALGKYAFGGYGYIDPVIGPLAFASFKERIFTGFLHLFLYLKKTVWPVDLSPDYSFNQIPIVENIFSSPAALLGLAFFIGILILVLFSSLKTKIAGIFFLVPYAVVSNIFFITTGTMAERWWYFPSLGLVFLMALGIEKIIVKYSKIKLWLILLGIPIFIWYSIIIFEHNKIWRNNRTLFAKAAEKSPNSIWARTNLAEEYFASKDFENAKNEIEAAMEISDKNPLTLYVVGKIYWREMKFSEAAEMFLRAVQFDRHGRNKRSIYRTLALLHLDWGKNEKALFYMEEAVKWPPVGGKENIIEIDDFLLATIKEYSKRNPQSYSEQEIIKLSKLIQLIRGF